jgi:hypothetical protein
MNAPSVKSWRSYPDLKAFIMDQARFTLRSCWEWPIFHKPGGYAECEIKGKRYRVHRLSYEVFKGQIPEGKYVCHSCDNPSCVNPEHLFLGSAKENFDDMMSKGRAPSKWLQSDEVIKIKDLYRSGGNSMYKLARQFGVTPAAICHIIHSESHVGIGPDLWNGAERVKVDNLRRKLLPSQVKEIKGLLSKSVSLAEISRRFGVSRKSIMDIREGVTWRSVG